MFTLYKHVFVHRKTVVSNVRPAADPIDVARNKTIIRTKIYGKCLKTSCLLWTFQRCRVIIINIITKCKRNECNSHSEQWRVQRYIDFISLYSLRFVFDFECLSRKRTKKTWLANFFGKNIRPVENFEFGTTVARRIKKTQNKNL